MVTAILLGVLSGLVGFAPLAIGLRLTKKTVRLGVAGSMMSLMLALLISFALLFLLTVIVIDFDKALAFPFVLAEVITLCVAAIGYGIAKQKKK